MRKRKKYKQGIFKPANPKKCLSRQCLYRSKLELTYMRWLDRTPQVVEWSSEDIRVPYIKPTDGKVHHYYLDFYMKLRDKRGVDHKYIIEIKPYKQTIPPKPHGNKKPSTILYETRQYAINTSKWKSAKKWAESHKMKFIIITDKDIKERYS